MRNASVMASWSLTSKATISSASLSEAARAAVTTSSTARSVAVMASPGTCGDRSAAEMFVARSRWFWSLLRWCFGWFLGRIQVVLGDVLDDPVRHEVPHGLAPALALTAVGRADRERWDLHHR